MKHPANVITRSNAQGCVGYDCWCYLSNLYVFVLLCVSEFLHIWSFKIWSNFNNYICTWFSVYMVKVLLFHYFRSIWFCKFIPFALTSGYINFENVDHRFNAIPAHPHKINISAIKIEVYYIWLWRISIFQKKPLKFFTRSISFKIKLNWTQNQNCHCHVNF